MVKWNNEVRLLWHSWIALIIKHHLLKFDKNMMEIYYYMYSSFFNGLADNSHDRWSTLKEIVGFDRLGLLLVNPNWAILLCKSTNEKKKHNVILRDFPHNIIFAELMALYSINYSWGWHV